MGVKRGVCFVAVILLIAVISPIIALAAQQPISIEIEQINVKMPQLKVYANVCDQDGVRIDQLESTAEFTAILDGESIDIANVQRFADSGEGIAVLYLVDISKSIQDDDFEAIKSQMTAAVDAMGSADQAAIITFGESVNVVSEYSADKTALAENIEALALTDDNTRFHDGMMKALTLSRVTDDSLPNRRIIVAVTDGVDEFSGGVTRQEVLSDIEADPVPIYAFGIYKGSLTDAKQTELDAFGEFARTSKGQYYQMGSMSFEDAFSSIAKSIRATQVLTLDCGELRADGKQHELYIALDSEGKKIDDVANVLIGTNMQDSTPPTVTEVMSKDKRSVTLTFSENVTGADDVSNYEVLDKDEKRIAIATTEYTAADGVYTATLSFNVDLGGEYTVTVSGVQDKSDTPNTIITQTETFLVDNILPNSEEQSQNSTLYLIIGGVALLAVIAVVLAVVLIKRKKAKQVSAAPVIPARVVPETQPMHTQKKVTPTPVGMPVHFAVLYKNGKAAVIDKKIGKGLTIGRSKDCDLSFDDDEMSRKHCEITWENGQMYANDLNATNTTIVNGVPIHERIRINSGDVLLIGQTELRVTWKEERQ